MSFLTATPLSILKSKEIGSKKTPPATVLSILPFKGTPKVVSGTTFFNMRHTAHSVGKLISGMILGHGTPVNIEIRRDAAVFGADDKEKKAMPDAKKASISIALDQLSPDALAVARMLSAEYLDAVKRPEFAALWDNPAMKEPIYTTPIKEVYSHRCPDKTKRGQKRDVPVLDLKVWFTTFPEGFKQLAGKPRTRVWNWATRQIDAAGKETFEQHTDDKGETLNAKNCGQILRGGDRIRRIEIGFDGGSVFSDGFSYAWSVYQIWTERIEGAQDVIADDSEISAPAAPIAPIASAAAPAAAAVAPAEGPIDDDAKPEAYGEGDD